MSANHKSNFEKSYLKSETIAEIGRVTKINGTTIHISGLEKQAALGDRVRIYTAKETPIFAEIVAVEPNSLIALADSETKGLKLHQPVRLMDPVTLNPCYHWLGKVLDPFGHSLGKEWVMQGNDSLDLYRNPPTLRRRMGGRLSTGFAILDTILPIVRGQRVGIFAGPGVGKSTLIAGLAETLESEITIIALIGERGREVQEFAQEKLSSETKKRSIIFAATSDMPATQRLRCLYSAMTTAEYFRDLGKSVVLIADSITRFAEAHREVATIAGEMPVLRGYPPSIAATLMKLCERAGPGANEQGDITAVFSVLVPGQDMDEPISDILRGTLDGHIILSRSIAERGRFPAIDVPRSASRALPAAATHSENALIQNFRRLSALYAENETMIKAGLYNHGSNPEIDQAIKVAADLDEFITLNDSRNVKDSFKKLQLIFRKHQIA